VKLEALSTPLPYDRRALVNGFVQTDAAQANLGRVSDAENTNSKNFNAGWTHSWLS
jgi:hypothetical protein